jgi:ribosome-associated protein
MAKKGGLNARVQSSIAIDGLQEIKGQEIVRMDLSELDGAITDYFVVCTATSDKHAQALSDSVEKFMKDNGAGRPTVREGYSSGEWILLDYVNVIVHIFLQERRSFYRLEALWGDAKFERIEDGQKVK